MNIKPEDLKLKLAQANPPLLLDVREVFEYQNWHIPGAVNLPLKQVLLGNLTTAKDRDIITICAHGGRSARATDHLQSQGFTNVVTLAGGMVEWNSVYDQSIVKDSDELTIYQIRRVGKGCLSYILANRGQALVIDPTVDIDQFLKIVKKGQLELAGVADTHAHADHISGGQLFPQKLGVPYYGPDEVGQIVHKTLLGGAVIEVGESFLEVISAPGHTPGSLIFKVNNSLFTGDTLFVESVGRPDLGQDTQTAAEKLYNTIHEVIFKLPNNLEILPAHVGEKVPVDFGKSVSATLAELRESIPAISLKENEFVKWVINSETAKPPNFEIIKQINTGTLPLPQLADIRELEAGPNRCAVS